MQLQAFCAAKLQNDDAGGGEPGTLDKKPQMHSFPPQMAQIQTECKLLPALVLDYETWNISLYVSNEQKAANLTEGVITLRLLIYFNFCGGFSTRNTHTFHSVELKMRVEMHLIFAGSSPWEF